MRPSLLLPLFALACNDPADRYQAPPASGGGGGAAPPAPAAGGGDAPPPGTTDAPGGGAPAVAGDGCSASDVSMENLPIPSGKGVTLSGRITGAGNGPALVEMVRLDGGAPVGVYNFVCPGVGPFELTAPPSMGAVYLVVFMDEGGDGPSKDDIAGFVGPVEVGSKAVDGLTIEVASGADLGPVALPHQAAFGPPPPGDPGEAPEGEPGPADEGVPPEGAPPEGAPPEGDAAGAPPPLEQPEAVPE